MKSCPSGKRVYRNRRHAETTLANIWAAMRPGRRLESRAYKCPDCDRWHLTKTPARETRTA